ncbi:MAG TPA: PaaI family thioesterase [Kofleriaceae bacterium]|nr:PaaI family thioesterase [Kofleriaceae bacterium]
MAPPNDPTDPSERARAVKMLAQLNRGFHQVVPHNRALGLEMVALEDGEARMRLPYSLDLVGNPESGVLHGGAISSLMDACCGASVFMKLRSPVPIATLDLRIDYLRPAEAGRDVLAHGVCFRVTRNVAFVRGVAYHEDEDDPVAAATGAFMLATPARRAAKPGTPP